MITTVILSLLGLILAIIALCTNYKLTWALIVCTTIAPLLMLSINYFMYHSKRKTITKIIFCKSIIFLTVLVSFGFLFMGTLCRFTTHNGDQANSRYEELRSIHPYLPKLKETKSTKYHHFALKTFIFRANTDILISTYSEDEYNRQKSELDRNFVFQESAMSAHAYVQQPRHQINGYDFRALSFTEKKYSDLYYPKRMVWIGTNDETNEIVYLHYYDDDLDYIDSMDHFFMNEFGWKYIQ